MTYDDNTVLIDSDALVGLQIKQDAHHQRARDIFQQMQASRFRPVVTNYVIAETANLLSRRYSTDEAKRFLRMIIQLPLIIIDTEIHQASIALFEKQTRPKVSLIDMSNVVVAQRFSIPHIFSFDKVYAHEFNLETLTL